MTRPPRSRAAVEILFALAAGDRHGYAIMRTINDRSPRALTLGPGTLYRTLQGLHEEGLVVEVTRASRGEQDHRRRLYRLTAGGRHAVEEEAQRMRAMIRLASRLEPRPGRA